MFIAVTAASDIGGYAAGVLFGKHPMAPVISPKKSWEGFAGSAVACVVVGYLLVVHLLDGDWWVGVILGVIAVVMATLGDLCESVMKRDLGIKDMSQVIPGHGGLMDRLDSLLATAAPIWLVLHYLAHASSIGAATGSPAARVVRGGVVATLGGLHLGADAEQADGAVVLEAGEQVEGGRGDRGGVVGRLGELAGAVER